MRHLSPALFVMVSLLMFPSPVFSTLPPAQETVPANLLPYVHARTLLDFSVQELRKTYRELRELQFTEDQQELPALLRKVGATVLAFFSDLPKTTSMERISQERTEPGRTEQLYQSSDYYYLISPQNEPVEIGFEEIRTSVKEDALHQKEPTGSFFVTSGHATHPIYFHPTQQSGSDFRYLGREKTEGQAYIIAFAQKPASAGMIRYLAAEDQPIPILLQGLAWIDPDTFQIFRMYTELLVPRVDVDLEYQTTSIRFTEVKFMKSEKSLYLPQQVEVTMKYKGFFFRNRHRYSQYRMFTVESQDGPKVPLRH